MTAPAPEHPDARALLLGLLTLGGLVALAGMVFLVLWSQREPVRERAPEVRRAVVVPASPAPPVPTGGAEAPMVIPPPGVWEAEVPAPASEVARPAPVTQAPAPGRGTLPGRWGLRDAPVAIVVFDDLQCPYCARLQKTLEALHQLYPTQVEVYFRDNPLDFHEQARGAHVAARCADQQGRFWPLVDRIFATHEPPGPGALRAHAEALGLDLGRFEACLASEEPARAVDADIAAARLAGVEGVPASFVGDRRIEGAQPLEVFEAAVATALAARR